MILTMLHEKLRELRKLNKLTISEVAGFLGISPSIYSRYERGSEEPTPDEIAKLEKYYERDLSST